MVDGFEDWSGRRFEHIDLSNTVWRETVLVDARFSGLITGLVVNDIEVAPLIAAEMDRRYPERTRLRPRSAADVAGAWAVIDDLWAATQARVAELPESTLHERVDDEWSCAETFRHLIFVTDAWLLGERSPIGLPPTFLTGVDGIDAGASPAWREVVAVRDERLARAKALDIDDEMLRKLHVVLDEEWHHNWFANRDLDRLASS